MKQLVSPSCPSRRVLSMVAIFVIVFSAAAAIIMAGSMYRNIQKRAHLIRSFEVKREQAYKIADQFESGSNTLTYEAKIFCETMDMFHFEAYVKELTQTRNRDLALQSLYRLGITPREMSRMQDAKIASDDLTNRELWAMELVALGTGIPESVFPSGISSNILTEKEKHLPPEEQYSRGYQYIMSASYFTVKRDVDTKVREFSSDLMQHYGASTIAMTHVGTTNSLTSFVLIVVLVGLMIAMLVLYYHIEKQNAASLSRAMLQARAASNAKSEFLSNMSHDIRTPMNAIMGMTGMAMKSLAQQDCDSAAGSLKIVQTSSRQLLSLINDVLDLSRIESGKMLLATEPYALPDVVRDISEIIRPLCVAKEQRYDVEISEIRHEFILGDQVRLRQVLLNILNNANKYTPPGGRIRFAAVEKPSQVSGTALYQFTIEDNGIGIAPEKLDEIFRPFSREINSTVNQVEGTGLGLTIVKSIVDARGGSIHVDSEKGKGSVFTVLLPLLLQDTQKALQRYAPLRGKKLLVAEQESGASADLCAMLREVGIQVSTAANLPYAVKAVQEELFPVVLVDRGRDGPEAVRAIRQAAPQQATILLAGAPAFKAMADIEASAFLERPLFRSVLFERIMELCREDASSIPSEKYFTGRRLLIVDDMEINRLVVQLMLESAGAVVQQAENGRQALTMFQESPLGYYDAILMDVMMPVMGGYEATGLIRALSRADASVPIVAMTANAFLEDVKKSREAGMDAHISKPLQAENVRRVLLGLLNGDRAL